MAVGNAVLDVMLAPGFLEGVDRNARVLWSKLEELVARHPQVLSEVRGAGLILGLRCVVPNTELVEKLRSLKLLTVGAGDNVVRLVPPLTIGPAEIDQAVAAIDGACRTWSA
jgi:acetylornithine/N-succinyldiaminopimelate aminotransferase